MRIIHVITTLGTGGAENHVLSLTRGQVAAGHKVHVAFLKGEGSLHRRLLEAGCGSVTRIPFERPGQLISAIRELARLIGRTDSEIVHTHLLKANTLGGIAARLAGGKRAVVATKHNDEHQLHDSLVGRLHGVISWLCEDQVICVSDHVADFTHTRGHVARQKITRIYNGFDFQLYDAVISVDVRREYHLPADSVVFGIVGKISPQKNHLLLLRAFNTLAKRHLNARLLIVGGQSYTNTYYEQVEREVARSGLQEQVQITGWRADAFNIIGGLDCLVMPSAWEGLGMVLLEAIVQGVPVIATRVSGIPEVVRNGIDGVLVAPGDCDALVDAMEGTVRRRAEALVQRPAPGLAYINEKFSFCRMLEQTLGVYQAAYAARLTRRVQPGLTVNQSGRAGEELRQ
jgi:glycosyltransferase involved in cell wall biosynthesis